MEGNSYGHEFIISVVVLMAGFHLTLDLLPMLYRRVRNSLPLRLSSTVLLILGVWFLL